MPSQTVLKRHAGLVDTMSATLGIDLEERALRGEVSISEIDDAVFACVGCTQPHACETWLARMAAPQDAPPAFCRNTELFARLAEG